MIKTKPNDKQYTLIYKYCILGYSENDILDRLLFSNIANSNPILYDDVINIIKDFNNTIKYKLCKELSNIEPNKNITLEEFLDKSDRKKNDAYVTYNNICKLEIAYNLCNKYNKEIEDIKW